MIAGLNGDGHMRIGRCGPPKANLRSLTQCVLACSCARHSDDELTQGKSGSIAERRKVAVRAALERYVLLLNSGRLRSSNGSSIALMQGTIDLQRAVDAGEMRK